MKTPESILRSVTPTDGIERAVAAFRYVPPYPIVKPRRWSAVAGLATALAVVGVALRLGTPEAVASPLARIAHAWRNAPRCTLRLTNADGKLWLQAWQEGPKNLMRADPEGPYGTETGYDGRRMWVALRNGRVAIVQSELTPFRAPLLQKLSDFRGKVVRASEDEGGGRTVVVERAASPTSLLQRDTIIADRLDRPVSVTHEIFRDGRWTPAGGETRDYETPIPATVFEFHPPTGYEVYDIDANRAQLRDGLRRGVARKAGGVTVRLAGVLQDRHGTLTAVYTGGTTPLPDASASVVWGGRSYPGRAVVGVAPDPRAGKPIGVGGMRFPGRLLRPEGNARVVATPEAYMILDGFEVRLVRFSLPKLPGNPARRVRLTLPAVADGATRTVETVRGRGVPRGTASFGVQTIPSNGGEEIYRLPGVKRAAYEVPLAKPKA